MVVVGHDRHVEGARQPADQAVGADGGSTRERQRGLAHCEHEGLHVPRACQTDTGSKVAAVESRIRGGGVLAGMSWAAAGNLVGQVAWFGSLLVLCALLPPRSLGVVAIGMVIANASNLLQDAGTRGAIVTSEHLTETFVRRAVVRNVGTGLALTAACALLARPISDHFASGQTPGVLVVLVLTVAIRAFSIVPLAVLQRTLHFREHAAVNAASMGLGSVVAVVAAALGAGVWALVLRQLVYSTALPLGAWAAARRPLRAELERSRGGDVVAPARGSWFLVLAVMDFVAFNSDSVIVGNVSGAARLGLYSLAFTLAFAPLTQFSWQIGRVLFGAAAGDDPAAVKRRTLRSMTASGLLLVPAVPAAFALAPVLLPRLLGEEWRGMVVPFEILLCVGVGHAVVNVVGESLSGAGGIAFRARVHCFWAAATVVALVILVRADDIRGAAIAHAVVFVPLATAYLVPGARMLGIGGSELGRALRGVGVTLVVQAAVTAVVLGALNALDASPVLAAAVAAAAGLLAAVVVLRRAEPLAAAVVSRLRPGGSTA